MALNNFQDALRVTLTEEGGKVDNPADPGGRTNQGITQKVYDAYRRRKGKQQRDVYVIGDSERDEIYRSQYWDVVRGDELQRGVDLAVFDSGVLCGVGRAIKWLQASLGVEADGVIGPDTLHAIAQPQSADVLINAIMDKREAYLRSLSTFKTFGKGWIGRVGRVRNAAHRMANGGTPVAVAPPPQPEEAIRPSPDDVQKAPPKAPGDVATGLGMGSGGVAAAVQGLQEQLTPFSMAGGWISKLVIALAVLSALLVIGGLLWRWYAMNKKAKIEAATK